MDIRNLSNELLIANKELVLQNLERTKLAAELALVNTELFYQNEEKGKRAAELLLANIELDFQINEKQKRADELALANIELDFQNEEKQKRASELIIANVELEFQNKEKDKRATELVIANKELLFQNQEKEKRAAELIIANRELIFQNEEKEKRAAELIIANAELLFQNQEKEKRAGELIIANRELIFQNEEKEKRAAELIIANAELLFQNQEKEKRAEELIIANVELLFQTQEKIRRTAAEAKKDEFFSIVSHEFKTPLTHIKAINQVLEKSTSKTDKIYPLILNANHSIKRLERLITDLLDVTKITSGEIDLNIAEFNFADVLTHSISSVQQISPRHQILLDKSINVRYTGDQFRIERVMINLLNNAIRYSPDAETVVVTANVEFNHITVCVMDFGIGIAKEDLDQLFKRFYRVRKTAMHYQGIGLGLYIAAEIIKKHGGTFSIESEPGKGSTFCFRLPLS
jgi:signal transduction histidine kinase